jgi:hypothetical protein
MTTIERITVTCAVCGEESQHTELSSTNAFGSPDLDLRPPPMKRQTVRLWVQACPLCGYVSDSIAQADDQVRDAMRTAEWKSLTGLPDDFSPETLEQMAQRLGRMKARMIRSKWALASDSPADIFLRRAFLAERAGDTATAAWATLWAAWVEDDEDKPEKASSNRRKAADLFRKGLDENRFDGEAGPTTRLVVVDVLRRSKQWNEALSFCRGVDTAGMDPRLTAVLRFQERLIAGRDDGCYRVVDATETGAAASSP